VDDKLDDIKKEIDALVTFKSRIEKAIEGCKEPLYISQQCLLNRSASSLLPGCFNWLIIDHLMPILKLTH